MGRGQNLVIEHRFAEGKVDKLPAQLADLLRLEVDVLVAARPGIDPPRPPRYRRQTRAAPRAWGEGMKCSRCHHETPSDANFCPKCGSGE